MNAKYTLRDVVAYNKKHPTFEVPPWELIGRMEPGMHAKCVFEAGGQTERMWVLITEKNGQYNFKGTLANTPAMIRKSILNFGDPVEFHGSHICQYLAEEISEKNHDAPDELHTDHRHPKDGG